MMTKHIGVTYRPAVAVDGLVFTYGRVSIEPTTGDVTESSKASPASRSTTKSACWAGRSTLARLVDSPAASPTSSCLLSSTRSTSIGCPSPGPARATVEVRMLAPYRLELGGHRGARLGHQPTR